MNKSNELLTPRLLLRPIQLTDLDMYASLLGDPVITLHIGGPRTRHDMAAKIIKDAATWNEYGYGRFVIVHRASQKPMGMCGVWRSTINELHFDEIGYAIFKEFWGQGYTTEAITALVNFAQTVVKLEILNAIVAPENIPSKKVLEKTGFHFVRPIDSLLLKNAEFWQQHN